MAALVAATFVPGVPAHSWQSAACAGMSIGRKGMVVAAKSLVLTAVDLYTDPRQVAAAKAGFEKRLSRENRPPPGPNGRISRSVLVDGVTVALICRIGSV